MQFQLGFPYGIPHFADMSPEEKNGRFLPSRVYSRWKWTVRFGLLLVPFFILLSGGVKLFLTPSKYRSTTLFEIENGPSPAEIAELAKSSAIIGRVKERLQLANRLQVDQEPLIAIVKDATVARILPDTRLIELNVTMLNKVDARDIAEQLPICVRDYLVEIIRRKNQEKAAEIQTLIHDAADAATEQAAQVVRMEQIHGAKPNEAGAATTLERARRASMLADAEVERLKNQKSAVLTDQLENLPRLNVHTAPVIAGLPHSPKAGEELESLALQSLLAGVLTALLLPYLMELVFSPRQEDDFIPVPVENL